MIERTLTNAWQAWLTWPLDHRLLSVGAVLLIFGFALLFWTPLGNRPVARYCFALAFLCHLLMWGVVRQFEPPGGSQIANPETIAGAEIEVVFDEQHLTSGSEDEKNKVQERQNPLIAAILDPRDRSRPLEPAAPPSIERAEPEKIADQVSQIQSPAPNIEKMIPKAEPQTPPKSERPEPQIMPEIAPQISVTKSNEPDALTRPPAFRLRDEYIASKQPTEVAMAVPDIDAVRRTQAPSLVESIKPTRRPRDSEFEPAEAPPTEKVEPTNNVSIPKAIPGKVRSDRLVTRANAEDTPAPVPDSLPSDNRMIASTAGRGVSGMGVPSLANRNRNPDFAPAVPPSTSAPKSATDRRAMGSDGDLAKQRSGAEKQSLLERFGGSRETERAVADALDWLAAHQDENGRWDGDGFMQQCPDNDECKGKAIEVGSDVGVSGLAVLAFLGAGHTHLKSGPYRETVRKGLNWILLEQHPDGDLTGKDRLGRIYSHAIATLAILEAYQMSGDERIKPFAEKAVKWLVRAQNPELGGWRYAPRVDSDTSVFGWALMALASGKQAGLDVPDSCWNKAKTWLPRVSSGAAGGLACYQPGRQPSASMTAEALVCRQLFGLPRNHPVTDEAVLYMLERPPSRGDYNIYYWYYGTFAMIQIGGTRWERWNNAMQDVLINTQRRSGHQKGSWDPQTPFGVDGGRVFSTAASTLCLEVFYRHLPLYSETPAP